MHNLPMAKKLIVIMANSDPGNPEELGTPLVQAAVAALGTWALAKVVRQLETRRAAA